MVAEHLHDRMSLVYLLLGSNIGDRLTYLQETIKLLEAYAGNVFAVSSVYETAPWGKHDQPAFLNQAIGLHTSLPPAEMLDRIHTIEQKAGRQRVEKWGQRIIDVDILFYGNEVLNLDKLTVPHPLIAERRFTLVPLCEIAPDFIHPQLGLTVRQILEQCSDPLAVAKYIVPE